MKLQILIVITFLVVPDGTVAAQDKEVIELAVRQHEALPVKLTNADVDNLFGKMSTLAATEDSASDVSCNVEFRRSGSVGEFGENEVPFSINSKRDFRKIDRIDNSVKVVGEINWCGSLRPGIIGCASRPGSRMAVVRMSGRIREAILWIHEYGHTTGSSHRDEARQVMRPRLRRTMRELNASECQRILTVSHLEPDSPNAITTGEPVAAEEVVIAEANISDVEAFVSEPFFEGVPYQQAIQFGSDAVPELVAILADRDRVEMWANAVSTLGAIGTEQAEVALMDFLLREPEKEISSTEYLALSNVPVALGWLASRDSDGSALETLIQASNSDWWTDVAQINWSTPIHQNQDALVISLVTKGFIGLTLTGSQEAAIRLEQAEGQIAVGQPQPILTSDQSSVVQKLGEDSQNYIREVSPLTRAAIVQGGGAAFIEAQENDRELIEQNGLMGYYLQR